MSQIKISVHFKLVPAILFSGFFLFIFENETTSSVFHFVCILYKLKTSEMECLKNGKKLFSEEW